MRLKLVPTSSPEVLAKAGTRGSGPFTQSFASSVASSSTTRAAPADRGKGSGKCKPGNNMCHKLKTRALGKGKSGRAERYDVDPVYRMNMQASGCARDLFFDDGAAVGYVLTYSMMCASTRSGLV